MVISFPPKKRKVSGCDTTGTPCVFGLIAGVGVPSIFTRGGTSLVQPHKVGGSPWECFLVSVLWVGDNGNQLNSRLSQRGMSYGNLGPKSTYGARKGLCLDICSHCTQSPESSDTRFLGDGV